MKKAKQNYWYTEDDIYDLLKQFFDPDDPNNQIDVFAQTQMEHEDLLTDNFSIAIENVNKTRRTQLMPIHLHGNHWAGAIVRMQDNGQIQVIYNDPLGDPLESQPNAIKLFTAVNSIIKGTQIIDLRLRQQKNSNDCGPFTVDNLYKLATCEGLDGLDREEILSRRILVNPTNGSALEIRNTHAGKLSRLEESYVENRTTEKLKEIESRTSNDEYKKDVVKLRKLKSKISNLNIGLDKDKKIEILDEIAKIASSVYRKEKDKSSLRNKFSSSTNRNILYLDTLELLKHLPSGQARINENLFAEALPKVISDLKIISDNISFVLNKEEKKIPLSNKPLKEIESIIYSENINNPQNLKAFISSFYMPIALEMMRKVVPSDKSIQEFLKQGSGVQGIYCKWENRIFRYYFARIFSILGELSSDILCVIPNKNEETQQIAFFQTLKKIRNGLKKERTHLNFFSDGNKVVFTHENGDKVFFVEDVNKFNEVIASFKDLDKNLKALQELFDKQKTNSIDAVKSVCKNSLPYDLKILTEFSEIIDRKDYSKGKDNYKGKVNTLIYNIIDQHNKVTTQEKKANTSSNTKSVEHEYYQKLNNFSNEIQIKYSLPNNIYNINNFGPKSKIRKRFYMDLKDTHEGLREYLNALDEFKKTALSAKNIEEAKKELQESINKYKEYYDKIKDEYKYDFPNPSDDFSMFEEYLNVDRENFLKNCDYFEQEAIRLKSITSFTPENEEQKQYHEFAVAYSVGIIGEKIRYLFEIDDRTNFLQEFARRSLAKDLNETRMVRNNQVSHNPLNYRADSVFRAATQNTTPWATDIKAIRLVHEFTTKNKEYLTLQANKIGLTLDQMKIRMEMFVGDSYVRLGQIDKAYEVLKNAKAIALANKDNLEVEEIIRINNLLAAIERKNGINTEALNLINESLLYVAKYPQYNSKEALLLNNKAIIISEVGKNKEAKKLYIKSMDQGFVPAAISLGQMLCEEKKYDEAIETYRKHFLKTYKERKKMPLEFIMILRGLWLAQIEDGQNKNAKRTFKNYVFFYSKNRHIFKEYCGQDYESIEAMILHDEGSNLYCEGHYIRAINRLENSLSMLGETGIRTYRDISHIHLNIANCYKYLISKFSLYDKDPDLRKMAIQHYESAIKYSNDPQSIDITHAKAGLANIYARQSHTKKSKIHQNEYESYGDNHTFIQSLLIVINDCISKIDESKNNNTFKGLCNLYQSTLKTINFCLDYMRVSNIINPIVAELLFRKFVCYSELRDEIKAIDSYKSFEIFVDNHPDCADHSHGNKANNIFHDNFNSKSLQESLGA